MTNFELAQIESICRRQNKCDLKTENCFGRGRKHCGKRKKCWLPVLMLATSSFAFSHKAPSLGH